ncbi:hypothetical protein [Tahibacter harae]|uniref:hypothetical protein n=1 Tax=Tahibacter harae TaxID=2963937 RepID=UPI00210CE1B6|nr:hypothetical protein [Tahibacter harae]
MDRLLRCTATGRDGQEQGKQKSLHWSPSIGKTSQSGSGCRPGAACHDVRLSSARGRGASINRR